MSFIRGSLLVFVSILLLISFLVSGIFATLNASLNYENVKPQINSLIKEIVENEVNKTIIDEQVKILQTHCKTNSEYVFNDEATNYTFIIPCEVIANGTDEIINKESALLIEEYYYKEYQCGFLNCFKEKSLFFLVSQHAKDFWKKQLYTFLIVSVLLAVLIFLLVEKKNNFPILIGSLLILGFLPLFAIYEIAKFVVSNLFSEIPFDLSSIALIFFSKANSVFLTGLILGIILIAAGIFLKLLKIGFKIEEWFEGKEEK